MLKTTQSKIILIICITEVLLITGLGIFFINTLNNINDNITNESIQDISNSLTNATAHIQMYIAIATITAILISLVIAIFLSKYIMYPINKLIESAEEIKKDEKVLNKKPKKMDKKEKNN